jgi:hypothetical protein
MNIRHPFVKLSALGALVAALPLLMAPTGGYPTMPTFQCANINTTGTCTAGQIRGSVTFPSSPTLTSGASIGNNTSLNWGGTHTAITMLAGTSGITNIDSDGTLNLRVGGATSFFTAVEFDAAGHMLPQNAVESVNVADAGTCGTATILAVTVTQIDLCGGNQGLLGQVNGGAPSNDKAWQQYADVSGIMHFSLVNDALSSAPDWMTVTRTGITAATVNFPALTTVTFNGASVPANVTGSYSAAVNGCTTSPNMTVSYSIVGKSVTLSITPTGACTSNATSFSISGASAPAGIKPSARTMGIAIPFATDNSVTAYSNFYAVVETSGSVSFFKSAPYSSGGAGWTAAGTKLLGDGTTGATISYTVSP